MILLPAALAFSLAVPPPARAAPAGEADKASGAPLTGDAPPSPGEPSSDARAEAPARQAAQELAAGDYAGAMQDAKAALTLDPRNAPALTTLAMAELRSGDVRTAMHHADSVAMLDPSDPRLLREIALIAYYARSYDDSLAAIDAVVRRNLAEAGDWVREAAVYGAKGDQAAALVSLDKAAQLDPRFSSLIAAARRGGKIRFGLDEDYERGLARAAQAQPRAARSVYVGLGALALALAGGLPLAGRALAARRR